MFVLPAAVWAALFLALAGARRPVREAALAAFTAVAIGILTFTEVLSLFHALSFALLSACWAALLCGVIVALRSRILRGANRIRRLSEAHSWDNGDRLFAAVLGFFVVGTFLSAVLYPIVNSDSLTCHAVRVFFWCQNHTIAHYATPSGPQLFEEPLGAYFVLTMKILAGGSDRLANLVQWVSYVFSIVGVSLIAMRLGAHHRGQQVAAVAAAAIPMAILQASTTQNDLNVAVWCLIAVYCAITFMMAHPHDRSVPVWLVWTGCALGLALLAKPTAYMYCFPYCMWLASIVLRRDGWKRMVTLASGVILITLLVNSMWYLGNMQLLGKLDPLATSAPGNTQTEAHGAGFSAIFTDAIKNGSMELGTPSAALNGRIEAVVRSVIGSYAGDIDDPATQEDPADRFRLDDRVTNHDVAPSPLNVLAIVVAGAVLLGSRHAPRRARLYLFCGVSAGFLAAELITYNFYINRLLLGALLLLAPAVGIAYTTARRHGGRTTRIALIAILGLAVGWSAVVMVFNSTNRLIPPTFAPIPVGSRNLGYWNTSYDDLRFRVMTPDLEMPYKTIASAIRTAGVSNVGLDINKPVPQFPIYPLLSLLADCRVVYVRDTLYPERLRQLGPEPPVIVEVVGSDQYPRVLSDGRHRGRMLAPPQFGIGSVLLVYETR